MYMGVLNDPYDFLFIAFSVVASRCHLFRLVCLHNQICEIKFLNERLDEIQSMNERGRECELNGIDPKFNDDTQIYVVMT